MAQLACGQRVLIILRGGFRHSGTVKEDDGNLITLVDERSGKTVWVGRSSIERLEELS